MREADEVVEETLEVVDLVVVDILPEDWRRPSELTWTMHQVEKRILVTPLHGPRKFMAIINILNWSFESLLYVLIHAGWIYWIRVTPYGEHHRYYIIRYYFTIFIVKKILDKKKWKRQCAGRVRTEVRVRARTYELLPVMMLVAMTLHNVTDWTGLDCSRARVW